MFRRRVKDALKRRFPVLVEIRDRIRGRDTDTHAPTEPPADVAEPVVAAPVAPPERTSPFEAPPPRHLVEPPPPVASGMTFEAVQAVLDDMVRPAVQSDGGDIVLIRVENNDVYVQMIGACHGCGSAPITLKLGVERLLQEEFPTMGRLVEIGGAVA